MTEFERNKLIKNLLAKYNFLNHGVIGKSHCERNIEFLSLGNFENSILWACAFHGMEWLTSLVILKFLENICNRIKSKNKILGIDIEKNLKNQRISKFGKKSFKQSYIFVASQRCGSRH